MQINVGQIFQPVIGMTPARAKLGVGSFITFDFGPLSRIDHHMVGKWHLWIYQSYWSLSDKQREIVNADSDRRYINLAIARLENVKFSGVKFDVNSLETDFRFGELHLTVRRPDYIGELDDRDHFWMFFLPNKQVLSVGESGVNLTSADRARQRA